MERNETNKRKDLMRRIFHQGTSRIKKILPIDTTLFLFQFFRHPNDIGSLTPSSAALANAMTRYIENDHPQTQEKYYLEAGAGTGAFTKAIIEKLGPNDHLDLIEINPKFCERLSKKYEHLKNVSIHVGSVLQWAPPYKYDAIVSSLPFNVFEAQFVLDIYEHYRKVIKPGGIVSYFEYMALPGIKKMFLKSSAREKLQKTLDATNRFEEEHEIRIDKVYANFPPACVHHCQFPKH
ncbi:MAG: Ribosomal RNA small subunit methyltransferase A [Chlamydiae bacterium]|nr:Ribosomal RNA small subunit methyltransferase A [Chlamydiota bacterium]